MSEFKLVHGGITFAMQITLKICANLHTIKSYPPIIPIQSFDSMYITCISHVCKAYGYSQKKYAFDSRCKTMNAHGVYVMKVYVRYVHDAHVKTLHA